MPEKIGRNDPCLCGSGKKYKHCCLEKERDAGPSRTADGRVSQLPPLPKQARPQAIEDAVHDLREMAGKREFKSINQARIFLDGRIREGNESPVEDFLGLSPARMHAIMSGKLDAQRDLVTLNFDAPERTFSAVPAVKRCRYLMKALADEKKGIRATQKGNFPRELVQDFYAVFLKEDDRDDFIPVNEDEVPQIGRLRYFLEQTGFASADGGRFALTETGGAAFREMSSSELYRSLLYFYADRLDWLSGTRYPAMFVLFQRTLVFCLYLLGKKAKSYTPAGRLAETYRRAFPSMEEQIGGDYAYTMVNAGFCHLFLGNFARELGLVNRRGGANAVLDSDFDYMVTGLFKNLLRWHL